MITVKPKYGAIEAARGISEPWLLLLDGDEWGESMLSLHAAAKTDYGFSDEDCALFAGKLLDNLLLFPEWGDLDDYGEGWVRATRTKAKEARDYWLAGGNLGNWSTTKEDAKSVIDQLPSWLFKAEGDNNGL